MSFLYIANPFFRYYNININKNLKQDHYESQLF